MILTTWRTRCYFEAQYMRLTTWRTRCYFEAQVWKKDSSIALFSFLFFSFLGPSFFFFWPSFFLFFLAFFSFCKVRSVIPTCGGIIVSIILSSLGQCSNNEDHHTFTDLQLKNYNSKLEQDMTLYECLRRCTGICNEPRATCMKIMKVALPQIRCQLHDHAKSNMTMMERVIITERWKVAWQYISEWLWKCHNR